MAFKPPQGVDLSMKLVVAGVPGKIAAIVGAAVYDQANLSPGYGRPVAGPTQCLDIVNSWFTALTGKSLSELPAPTPGNLPQVAQASVSDIEALLNSLFGESRPDLVGMLA
jgi:hypothetical protein